MKASSPVIAISILIVVQICAAQSFTPNIPKAWADKDVAGFEVPLVHPDRSPRYMTEEEYYALNVRPIYRSYPVYAAGREPGGCIEWLKQMEPEDLEVRQNRVFPSTYRLFTRKPMAVRRTASHVVPPHSTALQALHCHPAY
jgi:hypothetical protein